MIEASLLALSLCLGLAVKMAGDGGFAPSSAAPANATAPASATEPESRPSLSDLDSFQNYRERPPFSATRRRPPPPQPESAAAPAAVAPAPPLHVELVGIVGPADRRMALLRTQGASELVHVVVGDRLSGWQVTDIESTQLTLQQAGQRQILTFPKLDGGSKP
jgi:hypothetical protein